MSKKDLINRVKQAFVEAKSMAGCLPPDEIAPIRKYHADSEKIILQIIRDMPSPTIEHHYKKAGVS